MRGRGRVWALVWLLALVTSSRQRSPRQGEEEEDMNLKMLRMSVPGDPGLDYPVLATVPQTSFTCAGKAEGGYYADMETGCQVYHTCGGASKVKSKFSFVKYSTLCSNGTIYDQKKGTCHWWYLVDCESSEAYYFQRNNIRLAPPKGLYNSGSASGSGSVSGSGSSSSSGSSFTLSAEDAAAAASAYEALLAALQASYSLESTEVDQSGQYSTVGLPGSGIFTNWYPSDEFLAVLNVDKDLPVDFAAELLPDEVAETSTRIPPRPDENFFANRPPPNQISFHEGKVKVENRKTLT